MINGAHVIIYSKDPEADRAFFKDVLGFHHVDAPRWREVGALSAQSSHGRKAVTRAVSLRKKEIRKLNRTGAPNGCSQNCFEVS